MQMMLKIMQDLREDCPEDCPDCQRLVMTYDAAARELELES